MSDIATTGETKFEAVWRSIQEGATHEDNGKKIRLLFVSQRHGILALVDPFSKFMNQVIVAPHEGSPGQSAHFHDLPPSRRLQLHLVADAVGDLILRRIGERPEVEERPAERVIEHTEGYAVDDHVHLVLFSAARKEGSRLYGHEPSQTTPDRNLSEGALDTTEGLLHFPKGYAAVVENGLSELANDASIFNSRAVYL